MIYMIFGGRGLTMSWSPLRMTGVVAQMGGQAERNEGIASNMDGKQAMSGWGGQQLGMVA